MPICGWAGVWVSRIRRLPFILEIRDIWPESIATVGAMSNRRLLRLLEWLELRMYAAATRIVTVGKGYRDQLLERGVPADTIDIVPNGVDRLAFSEGDGAPLRERYGLADAFVCSYIGTIGAGTLLKAGLAAAVGARVGERVVEHHPRTVGVSKYGIGRTYKILTDMFVLRLLVRFAGRPLHYFGLLSVGSFALAVSITFVAFVDTSSVRLVNYSTVVMPSVALLGFCLAVFFLMMGLLCELATRTGFSKDDDTFAPLARLKEISARS